MISFIDECMQGTTLYDDDGYDEQRILMKSLSAVLPKIIENELTQKQRICLRLFYVNGKTQTEIARELKLSQPTVSRHLSTAKDITNKILGYCYYSVKKSNEQWLKLQ